MIVEILAETDSQSRSRAKRLRALLSRCPGETPVTVRVRVPNAVVDIRLPSDYDCDPRAVMRRLPRELFHVKQLSS